MRPSGRLDVVYVTGPGDVARTFRYWVDGERDPHEVSETYSAQFFNVARKRGLRALVIVPHPRRECVVGEGYRVEQRPPWSLGRAGVRYVLGRFVEDLRTMLRAACERPRVVLLTTPMFWWLYAPVSWLGVRVIVSLHGKLWADTDPSGAHPLIRVSRAMDRWFWRNHVRGSLCISAEVARQVESVGSNRAAPVLVCVPLFDLSELQTGDAWDADSPFRVLYLGRIVDGKGCDLMLDAATILAAESPGRFEWECMGDGELRARIEGEAIRRGLGASFSLPGHQPRRAVCEALCRACVVVAPTASWVGEGLNKSVIEAALAGKPSVTTTAVPAGKLVGNAAITIECDNARVLADAIRGLADDPKRYAACVHAAKSFRERYGQSLKPWGVHLETLLSVCVPEVLSLTGTRAREQE